MAESAREARRRKIVERGSDRLALITGRIQSLPLSSPQPHLSHTESSPLSSFQDQNLQPHLSVESKVAHGENDAFGTALPEHETGNESVRSAAIDTDSEVEPQLHKYETINETVRISAPDAGGKVQPSLVSSSTVQNLSKSMIDPEPRAETQNHHPKIFTANQISSSISASERTRLLCSITIALLVVLSHAGFPLVGSTFIKSIIAFRPLYLVLLTDVTVVVAQLFEKQGSSKTAEEEARRAPTEDGYGWAEGLGKALEMGLLLRKAINAAFLDCCVYAVLVVCGLSLVQHWY